MSSIFPIKINFPYMEGGVDFLIIVVGEDGQKSIDKYLSNFNL